MTGRPTHRSWWSILSIAMIGVLMLSLVAACGSDDDSDDTDDTTTTETTSAGSTDATEAGTDDSTPAVESMGNVMAIGECLETNTTADVVSDLRDGETESAEGVYRECLSDALPESMVNQLDPIIEQAGTCGTEAAADLSDEDIAAIEEGDQATIERVTTATLDCLSTELGIDLQ